MSGRDHAREIDTDHRLIGIVGGRVIAGRQMIGTVEGRVDHPMTGIVGGRTIADRPMIDTAGEGAVNGHRMTGDIKATVIFRHRILGTNMKRDEEEMTSE